MIPAPPRPHEGVVSWNINTSCNYRCTYCTQRFKDDRGRWSRDTPRFLEAFARLPDGSWLVAFERRHRLWRYPSLTGTPLPVEGPADIGRQPANGGIEAMAALADGTVIAITARHPRSVFMAWILSAGSPDLAPLPPPRRQAPPVTPRAEFQ
jgi:hypothetical protein